MEGRKGEGGEEGVEEKVSLEGEEEAINAFSNSLLGILMINFLSNT